MKLPKQSWCLFLRANANHGHLRQAPHTFAFLSAPRLQRRWVVEPFLFWDVATLIFVGRSWSCNILQSTPGLKLGPERIGPL